MAHSHQLTLKRDFWTEPTTFWLLLKRVYITWESKIIIYILDVNYGLEDMKKWIEQQVEQTKASGKTLSGKDQQRLEELAEKVLKMDQEKFAKEGEKLIKEMITIKQRAR